MSDEKQERVTCGCEDNPWTVEGGAWTLREKGNAAHVLRIYCHRCHTELSFDAEGNPVAEAMVKLDAGLDAERRATVVLARWVDNWVQELFGNDPDDSHREFRETMLDLFGIGADELDAEEDPDGPAT